MSDVKTKAVNLTEDEIEVLIGSHGQSLNNCSAIKTDKTETIKRINYLNKRLKAFKEPETAEQVKSEPNTAAGWGTGQ